MAVCRLRHQAPLQLAGMTSLGELKLIGTLIGRCTCLWWINYCFIKWSCFLDNLKKKQSICWEIIIKNVYQVLTMCQMIYVHDSSSLWLPALQTRKPSQEGQVGSLLSGSKQTMAQDLNLWLLYSYTSHLTLHWTTSLLIKRLLISQPLRATTEWRIW